MKRLTLFVLVFLMAFASVSPALAAAEVRSNTFVLAGRITAIGSETVTIEVLAGNSLVKPYLNQTLTVNVTDATRFLLKDGTTVVPITFADLEVGDEVSVKGKVANLVWTADRITVGALLIHFP